MVRLDADRNSEPDPGLDGPISIFQGRFVTCFPNSAHIWHLAGQADQQLSIMANDDTSRLITIHREDLWVLMIDHPDL